MLEAPSQLVIDRFFQHVVEGHSPTVAHRMLAHVSTTLSIRTILTTNFDNLIERGITQTVGLVPNVYAVSLDGILPAIEHESEHISVIKMHGSAHELRADYSLDRDPTEIDRQIFGTYFLATDSSRALKHLMVMGVSASERRIMNLIKYVLEQKCDPGFVVYWICFTTADLEKLREFSNRLVGGNGRIVAMRHTEIGMLLLHLFQVTTDAMPASGGIVLPGVGRLARPPQPVLTEESLTKRTPALAFFRESVARIQDRVNLISSRGYKGIRLSVCSSLPDATGLVSIAAHVFSSLEDDGIRCLWFDLDDVCDVDDLYDHLLEAVWLSVGKEVWPPTSASAASMRRAEEIQSVLATTGQRWVLFLNAREKPGSNHDKSVHGLTNGWFDKADSTVGAERILEFLAQLSGPACPSLSTIALVRGGRLEDSESRFLGQLNQSHWLTRADFDAGLFYCLDAKNLNGKDFETQAVDAAIQWLADEPAKQRFLLSVILMRRTRLIAGFKFLAEYIGEQAENIIDNWLDELEFRKVIRRKPGGLVWLHTNIRNSLRERLVPVGGEATNIAETHSRLAAWFLELFKSCRQPTALVDSIYHSIHSARQYLQLRDVKLANHSLHRACATLYQCDRLIRTGGFSRNTCRQLQLIFLLAGDLRALKVDEVDSRKEIDLAICSLQMQILTAMRGTAVEVAEHKTAFDRHLKLAEMQILHQPSIDLIVVKRITPLDIMKKLKKRSESLIHWSRIAGSIAMRGRSYSAAEDLFQTSLKSVFPHKIKIWRISETKFSSEDANLMLVNLQEWTNHIVVQLSSSGIGELHVETASLLEQYAQLCLLEENLARRNSQNPDVFAKAAAIIVRSAIRIVDDYSIIPLGAQKSYLLARIPKVRARLLCHLSVVSHIKGDQGSARHLESAESGLSVRQSAQNGLTWATVHLHKMELALESAFQHKGAGMAFGEFMQKVVQIGIAPVSTTEVRSLILDAIEKDAKQESWGAVRGYLARAWNHLQHVEQALLARRRNVWWMTWAFQRRMKLISAEIYCRLGVQGSALPVVGIESMPAGYQTAVEQLLKNSLRMVRHDSYRLATIVDAYAAIALGYFVAMLLDRQIERIPHRQQQMCESLIDAISELERIHAERSHFEATLSPGVQSYVASVVTRGMSICNLLRQSVLK